MILIGRGLDLRSQRICGKRKSPERFGGGREDVIKVSGREKFQREEAESWSDEAESRACAVLRVRRKESTL